MRKMTVISMMVRMNFGPEDGGRWDFDDHEYGFTDF